MCLILAAVEPDDQHALILAANRDEFHHRPTLAAGFWGSSPEILSGRDSVAGGTWMGLTRDLRFAAVTNYRDPRSFRKEASSRGGLVTAYLRQGGQPPDSWLRQLGASVSDYNGFNLLVGDRESIWWTSNRGDEIVRLTPGIHGLSNALLDTPWPKVVRGKAALADLLASGPFHPDSVLELLRDDRVAPDHLLPETGVGLVAERALSSLCVSIPQTNYGTCSSTVVWISRNGQVGFVERRYAADGAVEGETRLEFRAEAQA